MQISNDYHNSMFNDPEWYFLGEYSLGKLLADVDIQGEFMARSVRQTIGGLGIPPECLNNIERTLTKFARKAMADLDQGRSELPVYIRAFCQKKKAGAENSPKLSHRFSARHRLEPAKIFHHSDAEINGGWGYFLVDRRGSFAPNSTVSTYNLVDLYLYKEGE